jgi:hypothetical protein
MYKGLYSGFLYEPMEGLIGQVSILQERLQKLPPLKGEISGNCNRSKSTPQDNWPDNPKLQKEPVDVVWEINDQRHTYKLNENCAKMVVCQSYFVRSLCCSKESPDKISNYRKGLLVMAQELHIEKEIWCV